MARPDRRAQILQAATRLFAQHGLHATNIATIAKDLGIGHGTFYRYFDNKLDIFAQVMDAAAARTPSSRMSTNFADVRDIARRHLEAMDRGRPGRSHLLGSENLSVSDLLELAGGRRPGIALPPILLLPLAWLSLWVAALTGRAPLFTPAGLRIAGLGLAADCSRTHRELSPPQYSAARSLRDALRWFEERDRNGVSEHSPCATAASSSPDASSVSR